MHSPSELRSPTHKIRAAFSLVEVALAIAVVSVALVSILSLMSTGMGNYRQVMDTTICAQIAQHVISDAQQADYKTLTDWANTRTKDATYSFRAPSETNPALRYFDEQGNEIRLSGSEAKLSAKQRSQAVYWVNTRITPRDSMPRTDGKATVAGFQAPSGKWDPNDGGTLVRVTVEVACNPNSLDLKFNTDNSSPSFNLFDVSKTQGVRVLTYSALLSRNE